MPLVVPIPLVEKHCSKPQLWVAPSLPPPSGPWGCAPLGDAHPQTMEESGDVDGHSFSTIVVQWGVLPWFTHRPWKSVETWKATAVGVPITLSGARGARSLTHRLSHSCCPGGGEAPAWLAASASRPPPHHALYLPRLVLARCLWQGGRPGWRCRLRSALGPRADGPPSSSSVVSGVGGWLGLAEQDWEGRQQRAASMQPT